MAGLVSEDPVLAGCGHRLQAALHVQLGVDVIDVCFHRAQANDQRVGDLQGVPKPSRIRQERDLQLTGIQLLGI